MERADDDGDRVAVGPLQGLGNGGELVQPAVELELRGAAAFQDFGRHVLVGIVPGVPAGERIVQVHAGNNDHAPVVGLFHQFDAQRVVVHFGCGTLVHQTRQVQGIDAGIVAADVLGVGTAFGSVPLPAIHEVVVVAEHPALLPQGPEVGIEGLGFGGGVGIGQAEDYRLVLGRIGIGLFVVAAPQERHDQTGGYQETFHRTITFSAILYILGRSQQK